MLDFDIRHDLKVLYKVFCYAEDSLTVIPQTPVIRIFGLILSWEHAVLIF